MPVIPKDRISTTIKPDALKLEIGDKCGFKVTGAHKEGAGGLYSLPVHYECTNGEGDENFPLNTTHTRMFVQALGDNSDAWIGATFTAVVVPQNNPQSKAQVHSWSVIPSTITAKAIKAKK